MEITLAVPAVAAPAGPYSTPLIEANPADVTQFRALLSGEVSINGTPAPPQATNIPETGGTIGDVILRSLNEVKDRIQTAYSGIEGMVAPNAAPPTVTDVLALQYRLVQVSVEYELVSKVVSKSSQNLEQIVKVQ